MTVPVLAVPFLDPSVGRITKELPEGLTIAEILDTVMPGLPDEDLALLRVVLVSDRGSAVIDRQFWHRVRPYASVRVVIRLVPGKSALRSVLTVVVAIASAALGQYWATAMALGSTTATTVVAAGITLGLTVLGNLLINALIPPASNKKDKPTYFINGWRNNLDPDGVIPEVYGKIRFAPPFAATSYTEIVGDIQYLRSIFLVGYGGDYGLALSDFWIGDTNISEYDELTIETREGLASDETFSLYYQQVFELSLGVELTRNKPRNDQGKVISGPAKEDPIVRTTGADASSASVIIGFPAGLGRVDDEGEKKNLSVQIRIRQKPANASDDEYVTVTTMKITSQKLEAFYRQYTWAFATRGRYDIEVTRMTDEHTKTSYQSRTTWVALQTIRPEYPIDFPYPLAMIAMRVKATYQLNGQLDNFNVIASRRCLDWDADTGTWIGRETRNPASLYRHCLQSKSNPKPVSDSEIDLDALADWHEFCTSKGLEYNAVHDDDRTLRERLDDIAGAGRARARYDGVKWSVIIDRPQDLVVDHINPRNSSNFKASRTYFEPPHGFRIKFFDETYDYKQNERLVPWPGHSGAITLTEQLELPGKTNPDEIWIEARRRMYEALYRIDTYELVQDGPISVATRGDLVMTSYDVLERTQVAARVLDVIGRTIELDSEIEMTAGLTYGLRFRQFADADDTIGNSVLATLLTVAGTSKTVVMADFSPSAVPVVGDLVHVGLLSSESIPMIVTRVEAGEDMSSHLRLVNAATIIDELTDAETPPAWSGRAGADVDTQVGAPPVPTITSIDTGLVGTEVSGGLSVSVTPGSGTVVTAAYRLQHRKSGASAWTPVDFGVGDGAVLVTGYVNGDVVEVRVAALSAAGLISTYTSIVTVTIGEDDGATPASLPVANITVTSLLGGATIALQTSDDAATTAVQIYCSTSSTLNTETDAVGSPIAVDPSRSYTFAVGDATRTNLLSSGSFDSAGSWTLGSGWSVSSGAAVHASGSAGNLSQAVGLTAGSTYRLSYDLTRSAGSIQPTLTGGTTVSGVSRSASASVLEKVVAATGNTALAFVATDTFAGQIDNAVLYLETSTCLPQGTNYLWLQPQNANGVSGPVTGPIAISVK
ncbi:host specificity protein J [Rhizobium paknamense]|uniref:Fibronectin type-III domain-containing protein n=1 Tax=Rhizobium paknamense TaxID=1206817 RepID=A0ABU0I909_9HYPH|nr:phage tail protein [Rhizobium paknamense]MDQ0454724.1 hypothetical protein [Rhizobium paknamense]